MVRSWDAEQRLSGTGVQVVLGDVTQPESLPTPLAGVERVFHLAGAVGHRASDEPRLQLVNVDGAANLLAAARDAGVGRIVFTSSVSAMGPASTPDHPRTEAHSLLDGDDGRGDFRYGRSKARGEELALGAADDGMDVVIVNPGFVLGPGDVHRVSAWPVEEYLRGLLRFTVRGGLSYVDVRDVAAGHLLAEERGKTGERYILSNDEGNLSYPEFFARVGAVAKRPRMMLRMPVGALAPPLRIARALRLPLVPIDDNELRSAAYWWFYSSAKAREQLGYGTRPLDETLADTIAWFKQDGYRRH